MRLVAIGPALLVAGCAGTSTDNSQPIDRACSVSDCFLQREVRDFEVIDDRTLVVYVGGQRCAFRVELDGTFCDLTFAPEIFFRAPAGRPESERICSYDRQIGVDGGPFTENFPEVQPDRFGVARSQCRILNVASITDDELVELYVEHGVVAPPPPIGPGEISVEGATEAPPEPPPAPETDAAPNEPDLGRLVN